MVELETAMDDNLPRERACERAREAASIGLGLGVAGAAALQVRREPERVAREAEW